MRRLTFVAILVVWIGFGIAGGAQDSPLFPIVVDGKGGYIDATGKVVIQPRFEADFGGALAQFHEGLAPVNEPGGRKGFIDRTGRFVIAPAFSDAKGFSEGLAFVHALTKKEVVDGTAYIDVTGKRVISFPYAPAGKGDVRYAGAFAEGVAPVGWTVDTVEKSSDNTPLLTQSTKWGYVDKTGKLVIPYQFDGANEFSEGLAAVVFGVSFKDKEVQCGYIDQTGRVIVPKAYDRCDPFREGLAPVMRWRVTRARPPESQYGYIDKTGKVVVPLQYFVAEPFVDGLACVVGAAGAAFIDTAGKTVIKGAYTHCGRFSDGLAGVVTKEDKWGYVDKTGKLVIPAVFDSAEPFNRGLAVVVVGDEKTATLKYIDRTGKAVWSGPAPR